MGAKRLLSDIVSLTPSNYDAFVRCPRLFYCTALLGLPASDPAPSTDQGLLVHDMLRKIHADGECHDRAHVADVLVAHGIDTPNVREKHVGDVRSVVAFTVGVDLAQHVVHDQTLIGRRCRITGGQSEQRVQVEETRAASEVLVVARRQRDDVGEEPLRPHRSLSRGASCSRI